MVGVVPNVVVVAGVGISTDKMTVDNERYSIYEHKVGDIVNSITVLKPRQSTRGHAHKHWETYQFEQPGITLFLNGLGHDIVEAKKIEIPPKTHHRVFNNSDKPVAFLCQWLASDVEKTCT